MAPKSAVKEEAADYTGYAEKDPTALQEAFAEWLVEQTGVTFTSKQAEKAFGEGVRLATSLRMQFQASPEWRADERNSRYAGNGKPAGKASTAKGKAAPAKRGRPAKAQVETEDVEDEQEDEAPAKPATRRGRPAAAKSTAKPASGRGRGRPASGRRGASKPADEDGAAPY